ncbi:hypothetical protein GGI23_001454 [Coemansia sp. RSA 2559]|nr:hypothetical protein GGI23_001454 [Coemansia sp. RSA 2559]KAJ2868740.1 hypothetical protein GGI22_000678 [Coemansia erecta]
MTTPDAMTAEDRQLQQQATAEAAGKQSHYYFSMEPQAQVVGACASRNEITVALKQEGAADEGVVATVADFWTSVAISATNGGRQAVTTALTVQTLRPLAPDTTVHVVCRAAGGRAAAASALFADPADAAAPYATAVHTKAWTRSN